MTHTTKAVDLDSYDRDTLGYLSAFPKIGDAIMRRVEAALLRGARLEAELAEERKKVARVEALASYLETFAPGDRHYAARIRAALSDSI